MSREVVDKLATEVAKQMARFVREIARNEIKEHSGQTMLQRLKKVIDEIDPDKPDTPARLHFRYLGLTRFLPVPVKARIRKVRQEQGLEAAIKAAREYKSKNTPARKRRPAA